MFVSGRRRYAHRVLTGVLIAGATLFGSPTAQAGTLVNFNTVFGDIKVDLFDDFAPFSVNNFLTYVTTNSYADTIFHRSVNNFVIQGGGFKSDYSSVSTNAPIPLEYSRANTRGTIAMARTAAKDSATSQWFFNTADNTVGLGPREATPTQSASDGYAVFGWVLSGMDVVDTIAALPIYQFNSPFGELPLRDFTQADYNNGVVPGPNNVALVNSVTEVSQHNSFHNPILPADVDNSGTVTLQDANYLITDLLNNGSHSFTGAFSGTKYYDTTNDNKMTPQDALKAINYLLNSSAKPQAVAASASGYNFSALGQGSPSTMLVPEPGSLSLAGAASVIVLLHAWRRRRRVIARD